MIRPVFQCSVYFSSGCFSLNQIELFSVAAIQEGIDRANLNAISNVQKIKRWAILEQDFSVPCGELGPTLKLKRYFITEKYCEIINQFYSVE